MGLIFSCCKKKSPTSLIKEYTCVTCGKKFIIYKNYIKHKNKCNRLLNENRQYFIC